MKLALCGGTPAEATTNKNQTKQTNKNPKKKGKKKKRDLFRTWGEKIVLEIRGIKIRPFNEFREIM